MRLLSSLQRRLAWKLLLSYMVVVVVGVLVLAGTAQLQSPGALGRHAARMQALAGSNPALVVTVRGAGYRFEDEPA